MLSIVCGKAQIYLCNVFDRIMSCCRPAKRVVHTSSVNSYVRLYTLLVNQNKLTEHKQKILMYPSFGSDLTSSTFTEFYGDYVLVSAEFNFVGRSKDHLLEFFISKLPKYQKNHRLKWCTFNSVMIFLIIKNISFNFDLRTIDTSFFFFFRELYYCYR